MKVYIADENSLFKYDLPHEVQESFVVPYKTLTSNKEYSVSVEANEGKWVVKSNGLVNLVQNGTVILEGTLTNYASYQIELMGDRKPRYLYALPSVESAYIDIATFNVNAITIGSSPSCNVCYQDNLVAAQHITIQKYNNQMLLTAHAPNVYVNNEVVSQTYLKDGDIIFVAGLKIIYMQNFIRMNNPNQLVVVNGLQYYNDLASTDYTKYEKVNSSEVDAELYNNDSYFYHIPRMIDGFENVEITIDSPPAEDKEDHSPLIITIGSSLTMLASSFMMAYNTTSGLVSGTRTVGQSIPQIVMCVSMIIGSLIVPKIAQHLVNKAKRQREVLRQSKYGAYLNKKEQEINTILTKQTNVLRSNYPTQLECVNYIMNKDNRLWERQILDRDFLSVSVGNGVVRANINFKAPEDTFTLDEDNLLDRVHALVKKSNKLFDVPVSYSLIERRFSSIICNSVKMKNYIDNIILQLVTMHGAMDLKLVFFLDKPENFKYAKYFPHVWSSDKKMRFFADSLADMKNISEYIQKDFKERKIELNSGKKDGQIPNDAYKKSSPYYLVITDSYKKVKDIPIINETLKESGNLGISLLFLENNIVDLPPQCQTVTYVLNDKTYIIEPGEEYSRSREFTVPQLEKVNMDLVASKLLNIPVPTKAGTAVLPKSLTFLEMYNVSKIEQLNILSRWENNNPVNNLKTPIGVHADRELFMLDLHEKAHGPHGLIAGSTGSGKSEFIITFVLSLAINFHPNEVQFVLIDYKGGGLAGAFENREKGICIPHLAGTITNLDTAEMNRTLVSINSELKRRQAKFNEERDRLGEGTIDIYKYQKLVREGKIKDPIAHLFIISDEFAELKSQQPEFMNELISTARIGRSLGVHLILATQKPSGVVNDQIWANSKFKICLKVQDRGDSMEMIKKPDAASIKETGRFYLQVGFDEYFDIGQSGYSGANYIPSDRIIKKVDDSINYIDSTGQVLKTVTEDVIEETDKSKEYGDQLTNIVKYIVDISKKQKIKINKLWLSSIPGVINLDECMEKYNFEPKPYEIVPALGEYDNPSQQKQGLLTMDLTNKGHLLVYGMAGSGKENLLTTLIYNLCTTHSPDEVNFYILDFGAETLQIFSKYPHIGAMITASDEQALMDTLVLIDEEANRRKGLFTEYGGSYRNYIKESGQKLPLMVVVINYYEVFSETNSRLAQAITSLVRDGMKYGIIFVVTTATNNSLGGRLTQLFLNKISLQQPDDNTYRTLLNSPKGLSPKKFFGRGVASFNDTFYEFQTAYITEKDKVNKLIRETAEELNSKYTTKAKRVSRLPENIPVTDMLPMVGGLDCIPIGLEYTSKEPFGFSFANEASIPIISDNIMDKMPFIKALARMFKQVDKSKVTVVDTMNIFNANIPDVNVITGDYDNNIVEMIKEINKESDEFTRIFIIIGFNKFKNAISSQYQSYFNSLMSNIEKFKKSKLVIVDDYNEFKNLQVETWFDTAINKDYSIWLGNGIESQVLLNYKSLSQDLLKEDLPERGFVSENGEVALFKYTTDKEGEQ